jgi:hypothetical protein
LQKHHGCDAPKEIVETSAIVVATLGKDGVLSLPCLDGVEFPATTKTLVAMLLHTGAIEALVDRSFIVHMQFTTVDTMRGVMCKSVAKKMVCADGVHRTRVNKLIVSTAPGAGDFSIDDALPIFEGVNRFKLARILIPL